MRSLVAQMVRDSLQPYREKIVELEHKIEDLERRQQSQIRLGFVDKVHESGALIRVQHGSLLSPYIRWFACAAGETTDYRCPSKGEQAVLLNYGGGDSGAQTVALIGLFSDKFPAPTTDKNLIIRCYPDGAISAYNLESKVMTIKSMGDLKIKAFGKVEVTSAGETTVNASQVKLNDGKGVVTGDHICMVTGKPHGDCSSTVMAGK